MPNTIITPAQIENRERWVKRINTLPLDIGFSKNSETLQDQLEKDISSSDINTLLGHIRTCGVIPEKYGHDTSEEKLYSKYTDIILHETFKKMGLNSLVLKERSDVADVECTASNYSFVADAKAFRLSRTAKNQKDFKVQAMHRWKHGKPYAIVICPIYQLPSRTSQIYQQAGTYSVCVGTYSHLAVLARYCEHSGERSSQELLHSMFKSVDLMNPSKDATEYWKTLNGTMLNFDSSIRDIWAEEKIYSMEAINIAKREALSFLASKRAEIMELDREQAIKQLLESSKITNKIKAINAVSNNHLMDIE